MKLDIRTMLVCVSLFTLGYLVCLAMPMAEADKPEVSEIIIDHIVVKQGIQFGSEYGPELYIPFPEVNGQILWLHGALGAEIADGRVGATVTGGNGLDVGKLNGHPAEDFVLKSELSDLCQICPIGIEKQPVKEQ